MKCDQSLSAIRVGGAIPRGRIGSFRARRPICRSPRPRTTHTHPHSYTVDPQSRTLPLAYLFHANIYIWSRMMRLPPSKNHRRSRSPELATPPPHPFTPTVAFNFPACARARNPFAHMRAFDHVPLRKFLRTRADIIYTLSLPTDGRRSPGSTAPSYASYGVHFANCIRVAHDEAVTISVGLMTKLR